MRKIRTLVIIFQVAMFLSGVTAFFVPWGIDQIMSVGAFENTTLQPWLLQVQEGVAAVDQSYPFILYGTDWLAFAHILFAILFYGAYVDPIRNKWLFKFGIIASLLIFPLAFIMGNIRGIPVLWQLMDCSFGLVASILLYYTLKKVNELEHSTENGTGVNGTWSHNFFFTY